ncbi:MAG TPA: hypothetical protein VGI16_09310 [Candidatus Acidoferrum sp.]|jgi:hypothetical protein
MLMKSGERWHCTNRSCRCSLLVESSGEIPGRNPICACGSAMKKDYSPPSLSYLEFLRVPEAAAASLEPGEK